jgi:uncharacterized protein (UPF0335 family)
MNLKKEAGTCIPFTSPKAFESLKIDFQHSVKRATLETYRKALQTGFDYLKEQSGKHNLTTLKSLFITYKDENDLCDLIQSYLATNIGFKTYRYSAKDDNLKESISHTDITATEARNLLYLIRCHEVSQGVISEQSKAHIAKMKRLETYINKAKKTKSLHQLYKELPEVKTKHIKNIYNGQRINERTELNRIIRAILYWLTYNHQEFTTTKKGGRIFNALTNLSRTYRENEFAFQVKEFDIKSANPQIIDKIFNWNNYKNVYPNLMSSYNISRDKAKELFNSTLNNHRLNRDNAMVIYRRAGYGHEQAEKLASITSGVEKGTFYRYMAKHEAEIINEFTKLNINDNNFIRLHDAVFIEPEFSDLDNVKFNADYGTETTAKANITLDLSISTNKTILTAPAGKNIVRKQTNKPPEPIYKAKHFTFYATEFEVLNANFNINEPEHLKGLAKVKSKEDLFIERVEKLYYIISHLNPNEPHRSFKTCIDYIASHQGISFNKNHIYAKTQEWEYSAEKAKAYIKIRNWEYSGRIQNNRYDFQHLYYEELRECKNYFERIRLKRELNILLRDFRQYGTINAIDKSKYDKRGSTRHIIKKIDELIGIKKVSSIDDFNEVVTKIAHPIREFYIGCAKNVTSERNTAKKFNVSRRLARKINHIIENREDILRKLSNAIQNLETLQDVEALFNPPAKEVEALKPITPQKAFEGARNDDDLKEWNKLERNQKNIYLNNNVNGYLEWKAQTRATAT